MKAFFGNRFSVWTALWIVLVITCLSDFALVGAAMFVVIWYVGRDCVLSRFDNKITKYLREEFYSIYDVICMIVLFFIASNIGWILWGVAIMAWIISTHSFKEKYSVKKV